VVGRAIAHRLAAEGACVIVADRDADGAKRVAEELGSTDVSIASVVDVTDEDAIVASLREAVLAFGGVDLIVNNAGMSISKPLLQTTVRDWDVQHDVMARGSFLVSREAVRVLRAQGMGGDIVYISSKNALFAGGNNLAYGATKADQAHQVRLLATELGADGIRVNGINPDGVARGQASSPRAGAPSAPPTTASTRRTWARSTHSGRCSNGILPEHVANAVHALTAGDLSHTTGLHIPVDAGVAAAFLR